MMAISSLDDILKANAANQRFKFIWFKQVPAACTIGKWFNTACWAGCPPAMIYPAGQFVSTNLNPQSAQCVADVSPYLYGTMPHGGNVAPYTKYLTSVEVHATVATGVPTWLMLVDLLMYYPGISMTTGGITSAAQQVMNNTVSLPRYTNGNGVMMFLEANVATGATASYIVQGSNCINNSGTGNGSTSNVGTYYTNSSGSAGQSVPGGDRAPGDIVLAAATASPHGIQVGGIATPITGICHSGVTASYNFVSPFLQLAPGDTGVRSVYSLQISSTTASGMAALVLCKPLVQIPLQQTLVPSGRDFVFNMPTLPVIYDGACLAFLLYCGAATAQYCNLTAALDFVWG